MANEARQPRQSMGIFGFYKFGSSGTRSRSHKGCIFLLVCQPRQSMDIFGFYKFGSSGTRSRSHGSHLISEIKRSCPSTFAAPTYLSFCCLSLEEANAGGRNGGVVKCSSPCCARPVGCHRVQSVTKCSSPCSLPYRPPPSQKNCGAEASPAGRPAGG
jgi:hypothetical protein